MTIVGDNATLTAVTGIRVGHATAPQGGTVVLGSFRGAVEVTGMATGTRELGVLDPRHLTPRVDALLLTAGRRSDCPLPTGWLRGSPIVGSATTPVSRWSRSCPPR